jgi:hypothetical protein
MSNSTFRIGGRSYVETDEAVAAADAVIASLPADIEAERSRDEPPVQETTPRQSPLMFGEYAEADGGSSGEFGGQFFDVGGGKLKY